MGQGDLHEQQMNALSLHYALAQRLDVANYIRV